MILAAKVYNSKLSFWAQFCAIANMSSYEVFKTLDLHFGTKHSKRWFFSYSLSQMTGLAESSVIKTFSDDAKKVIDREQQDAAEIVKIEKQTNNILLSQKEQNDRVAKLYSDKNKLNENLKNVISDERNIEHRVNDIIKALETFSDVNLEYESFSMLFTNIEELLRSKFCIVRF
jgi:predicted nuclease with TOPRIM domain